MGIEITIIVETVMDREIRDIMDMTNLVLGKNVKETIIEIKKTEVIIEKEKM